MRRACSDWRFIASFAALIFSALLVAVVVYLPHYHDDHAAPTPTATRTAHPVKTTHRHPTVDGPAPHPAFTPAPQPQRSPPHPPQHPSHKPSPHPTHRPTHLPKPAPRPSPSPTCVLGVVCL